VAVGHADQVAYYVLPPGPLDAAPRHDAQLNFYLKAASRVADHHPYPGLVEGPGPLPLTQLYVRQLASDQGADADVDKPDTANLPVTAETIFLGVDRVRVVLAAAGGGKSSLLRRYLATSASQELAHGMDGRVHAAIPVLIRATALVGSPLLARGLAEAVVEELGPYGLREMLTSEFFSQPPSPRAPWLVMVDGLDEVPDRAARVALLERLAREADEESSPYRFIVATRPLPRAELDRLGPGTDIFELHPFTPADVRTYARGIFRDLPESEHQVRVFVAGLRQSGLDDLARTPLMAFMLCQLHATDPSRSLPDGRTSVYQSFVELLYEQNTHKSIRHTHDEVIRVLKDRHQIPRDQQAVEQAAQLVREGLPQLIDHLAHERISGNTEPAVDILARWLHVQRPAKVKPPLWNAFLGDLLRPAGLLAERSNGFHFLHQTLLEFHSARHATRNEQARAALLLSLFRNRNSVDSPYDDQEMRGKQAREELHYYVAHHQLDLEYLSEGQARRDEQDRASQLHELLHRQRDRAGRYLSLPALEPSYLGFLLDGLIAPADYIAAETIRTLDELAAPAQTAACQLLVQQVQLRTNLPADLTAGRLSAFAQSQDLDIQDRSLAAAALATVPGHRDEGATLLFRFADNASLAFKERARAARHLADVDGRLSEAAQLLISLAHGPGIHLRDRVDATRLLATLGDERAAAILITLAGYDDPEGDIHGHLRAAKYLSYLPKYREEAAIALIRIATDTTHWDKYSSAAAAESLARLDGYRTHGIDLLTRLAREKRGGRYARDALARLRGPGRRTA
jgi:hypothetical protein